MQGPIVHDRFARSEWFRDARFGMFLHWGPYSIAGREEWLRSVYRLSKEEYQPYVDGFVPEDFDPEAWADIAERAGMRYAVLTAKHHDGFCLFDSAETTYSTMHNGFGRDVVREFVEAFRRRGIKIGLYYSLLDWHHPDYPAWGDRQHPHRDDEAYRDHEHDFANYVDYLHAQVRELCTNYGDLDLLWFDFSYDDFTGERWRSTELVEMVRSLQPDIVINNRLEASGGSLGSLVTADPTPWAGDFVTAEQLVPIGGIRDDRGEAVPWESCLTMNNHWGHYVGDDAYKSSRMLIRNLVSTVSRGGNMLLNVGPQPSGRIGENEERILGEIGEWLARNGDSIYGAGPAELSKPDWGCYTRRDRDVFAHVFEPPIGPLAITGIDAATIAELRVGGEVVGRADGWLTEAFPDTVFVSFGDDDTSFTYPMPDETDTVVAIRLRSDVVADTESGKGSLQIAH